MHRASRGGYATPITLYDIARRAEVSVATVSRVLNGTATTVPISEATRERVRTVARELHYRPNLTARGLVQGSTRMLGLVLPKNAEALRSNYHAIIVAGISSVLSAYGYELALYFSDYGHSREGPNHAALLQDGRVDGGLVVDSYALSDDQIAELEREALSFPFVLVGHRLPKSTLNWVAGDDRGGPALHAVRRRRPDRRASRNGSGSPPGGPGAGADVSDTMLGAKLAAARAVATLSRVAARGGPSLPGKVLIALAPDPLSRLPRRLGRGSTLISASPADTPTPAMLP